MTVLSFILFVVVLFLLISIITLIIAMVDDGYFDTQTFLAIMATSALLFISFAMALEASEWQVVKSEIVENYTKKETDGGIQLLTADWSTRITITEWEPIKKLEDGKAVLYRQEISPVYNKHAVNVFYKLFDNQGKELNIRYQNL